MHPEEHHGDKTTVLGGKKPEFTITELSRFPTKLRDSYFTNVYWFWLDRMGSPEMKAFNISEDDVHPIRIMRRVAGVNVVICLRVAIGKNNVYWIVDSTETVPMVADEVCQEYGVVEGPMLLWRDAV